MQSWTTVRLSDSPLKPEKLPRQRSPESLRLRSSGTLGFANRKRNLQRV